MDLFDYKPLLNEQNGEQLPDHVRGGQRLTGMSAQQASIPLAGLGLQFQTARQRRARGSANCCRTPRRVADDLCFIRSMFTEAINHDPAITFFQTGSQIAGRPSLGSWVHYGLGSVNDNLPAFIVLVTPNKDDQPLYARLWGSGFLDTQLPGRAVSLPAKIQSSTCPIPTASAAQAAARCSTSSRQLNRLQFEKELDPEIESRIAQYEMAFRMQTSVPEVTDLSKEPERVFDLYGPDAASRARSRPIACWPGGWPNAACASFSSIIRAGTITAICQGDPQPMRAKPTSRAPRSIHDLKQRGMLDDTLVIWGGEFGRTCYSQGTLTTERLRPRSSSALLHDLDGRRRRETAASLTAETDDYGYNIADDNGNAIQPDKTQFTPGAVHVHDLQATILHLLGIDHERLNFLYQGRRFG